MPNARRVILSIAFCALASLVGSAVAASAQTPAQSAWVEYAADGVPHVRTIATAPCPTVTFDRQTEAMTVRAAATDAFPNVVCDARMPAGTKNASVAGRSLPVPHLVSKIAVIGDTGCRLKGAEVQACNDPKAWPFPVIAQAVANERPDAIIHVGDYYYRETPCPPSVPACAGSPTGDAWAAWNADWFTPAAPLFAAAPMVLVRGNHEDCKRGGVGWFRYLDGGTSTTCADRTPPFGALLGGLRLVVFDSATADDENAAPADVSAYAGEFAAARQLANGETWLLTHRPPYAVTQDAGRDVLLPLNATLQAAGGNMLTPYSAILAGHVHIFEALDVAGRPPIVVNGMGGDRLDPLITVTVTGTSIGGARVNDFSSATRFGYAIYQRSSAGWNLTVHAPNGDVYARCVLGGGAVHCQ